MRIKEPSTGLAANGFTVRAIAGTYVVMLGIDMDKAKATGLLGFAIKRTDHTENESYWLKGMRTFKETNPNPPEGASFSTQESPVQDFLWSDFTAKPDHDYAYEVVPVRGSPKNLAYDKGVAVNVRTESEDIRNQTHSVYFNRGVIGSQAYTREFVKPPSKLKGTEKAKAYKWLSRGLEEAMLAFISQANARRYALRAAVYEFDWTPVSEALKKAFDACGDVRIIFDARVPAGKKGAENKKRVDAARKQLRDHGLLTSKTGKGEAVAIPRAQNPSYIAHNKFIVLLDNGNPVSVWTGSTNFTESGIFGQSNVGHAVRDANVAAAYHEYWKHLAQDPAADSITTDDEQQTPTLVAFPPPKGVTPIFSPRKGLAQLNWYANALGSASKLDCFTAAFGVNKVFLSVFQKKEPYLRYVFLEKWAVKNADVEKTKKALTVDPFVQVAVGAKLPDASVFGALSEFLNTISTNVRFTHNKFALVDPLGDDPVVVTGSANFSDASTTQNDENMLVIRGDTRVADIYLGEYMRLWRHHNYRDIVTKVNEATGKEEHNYLASSDSWTEDYYKPGSVKSKRRETFA